MSNLEPELFEQQVRDCLAHYYDYAFLQHHPLVYALAASTSGDAARVQGFREVIEQAIDSMKPGPESDAQSKQARLYSILLLRYINQQQVQVVLYRLNLSERQFYRDHNKAIRALCSILRGRANQPSADAPSATDNTISIQSDIQRVYSNARPEQIDARTFLNKTLVGIHGLLQHYDTQIDIDVAKDAVLVTTGTAVLRQAIISILSRLVIQSTPNSHFAVSFWDDGAEGHFAFECVERSDQACLPQLLAEQMAILHSLMRVIGGRVEESSASSEAYHISLHFPLHKSTLLVIDDNPDAIALFQRFASGQPYQIMAAYDGTQALQLAQEASPALIILDVLLPQQDGWEILQTLKSHPLTSHIPVLICSVLDSPELARVLGADGFLRKPPNEAEFLDTLAFFCPIGDSIKNNVVGR